MSNSIFNKTGPSNQGPKDTRGLSSEDASKAFKEFKRAADEHRGKEFPKINTVSKDIKFNHSTPYFGASLGMSDTGAGTMAAKFATASTKARKSDGGYVSKVVEAVLPTLSPEEIAFCVGVVVKQKLDMERQLGGDMGGMLRQMGINPDDL
jgi:hypothetical protein